MRIKVPNTFVLIFLLTALIAAATWVVPGGSYQREERNGREIVVAGTFAQTEAEPQGLGAILLAPIKGFVAAAEIIGFVLLVGGTFGILAKTGAIEAGLRSMAAAHSRSAVVRAAWIPLFMTVFSLGGAIFGMSEEVIPFILIFVPLALSLGYDSIVGVAVPFVGAGAGFAAAFLNPFTIGVAQGIAGLEQYSGLEYRLVCWVVITAVAITWVGVYAHRIRLAPERSLVYEIDRQRPAPVATDAVEGLAGRLGAVLVAFAAGIALLVWGVLEQGWYIEEIAALFIGLGIVCGIVGRLSSEEIVASFLQGARDLVATALLVAFARGILVVATDGKIIDSILHALSGLIGGLHPIVSGQVMFLLQSAINFLVPSGSGQAALTMPVMAPLADLVGVSRQTAVLAFQFGDGFTNLIIPTSAICMGVLALAGIPWSTWVRWMWPLQVVFVIVGCLLLVPAYFLW
jgi:uncharacterized ion transporter superfamily protein YfcC